MIKRLSIEDYKIIADIVIRGEDFKAYKIEETTFHLLEETETWQKVLFTVYGVREEISEPIKLFLFKSLNSDLQVNITFYDKKKSFYYVSEEAIKKWLS